MRDSNEDEILREAAAILPVRLPFEETLLAVHLQAIRDAQRESLTTRGERQSGLRENHIGGALDRRVVAAADQIVHVNADHAATETDRQSLFRQQVERAADARRVNVRHRPVLRGGWRELDTTPRFGTHHVE